MKYIREPVVADALQIGNDDEIREFTTSESLKPSIDDKIIPKPIENPALLRELNIPSYYIDATVARKSLIMNKRRISNEIR